MKPRMGRLKMGRKSGSSPSAGAPEAVLSLAGPPPNNGMHPTADTTALIYINRSGRRVMPGVGRLQLQLINRSPSHV